MKPRSALTINDQPVENRNQLVGALVSAKARAAAEKAPRRSTEASPQSTGCLSADALRQRQRAAGRGVKGELIKELEIRALPTEFTLN